MIAGNKLAWLAGALVISGSSIWGGYWLADTRCQATLSDIRLDAAMQANAQAFAAFERYQTRTEQLAKASSSLDAAYAELEKTRLQLTRKLTHAAKTPVNPAPAAGLLSIDGLRYYNEAFGLHADGNATGSGEPSAQAAGSGAIDSGVSRSDLLAHVRDTGLWCQGLAKQRDGLIDILLMDGQK